MNGMSPLRKVIIGLVAFGAQPLQAQAPLCGTDAYLARHSHRMERMEAAYRMARGSALGAERSDHLKVIPVVVHIFHQGGPENISDAQVQSQIQVLNEDYGKLAGTNGDGSGVDTEVRFCLAQVDPDGACTNGIVRINSPLADHQSYQRTMLKQISGWDNTRYLNIYVVQDIDNNSGTLGYSSFPDGPADEDGIVVLHKAFGTLGTVQGPYHLGRTASHEAGHWLGLYHTFQDGCGTDVCTTGDLVCDTPPVAAPHFGCPASANTCSNDLPDVNDLVDNYMDYTNDACKSMFTQGQKDRMQDLLELFRYDIWQAGNTTATGCDSSFVPSPCAAVANFATLVQQVCTGNPVQFVSTALNDPLGWQWYFPGGTPTTSAIEDPVVSYATPGTYDVALVVQNTIGSDSLMITGMITVADPVAGQLPPFTEGFESLVFPPNGITVENPDGEHTWELDTVAVQAEGIASARIDNLTYTNYGQSDALVLPSFDLLNFGATPSLRFRWAYARSSPNYSDQLVVLASTDCGVNFSQIWTRSGGALATGPTQTTPYIPDSTTTWKSASISLAAYQSSDHVLIKLVNVTDGGNYLYVDRISVGDQFVGIKEQATLNGTISVFPNPSTGTVWLQNLPPLSSDAVVLVRDGTGRSILTAPLHKVQEAGIDLSAYAAGLYVLTIRDHGAVLHGKVNLQH